MSLTRPAGQRNALQRRAMVDSPPSTVPTPELTAPGPNGAPAANEVSHVGVTAESDAPTVAWEGEPSWDTPYFVVSRDRLAYNLASIQRALPDAAIYYAVKANSEPSVLRLLDERGAGFEAASAFELDLLLGLGVSPDRIVFGTAVKSSAQIRRASAKGIDRYAADSESELARIASSAPGGRVYMRVRVDDREAAFPFSEKFGADVHAVEGLFRTAKELGLQPYGLSFHVGSQAMRAHAWASAIRTMIPLMERLKSAGTPVKMLNIGGGFPCQYDTDALAPSITEVGRLIREALLELPNDVELMAEPGRFIAGSACSLVASVIARVERGTTTWLFLDAGCYNGLFESMSYQGSTRYTVERTGEASAELMRFSVAGPTGDSPDVVGRDVLLPADTDVESRLLFRNAGAYSMSMAIPFNGFPKPDVRFV